MFRRPETREPAASDPEYESPMDFVNAPHLTSDEWDEASAILMREASAGASFSQIRDALVRRFGHRQGRFSVVDGQIVGDIN